MSAVKYIIIDDETQAIRVLKTIMGHYYPDFELVAEGGTVAEGISILQSQIVDLVFLDIDMPGGSGFELLAHYPERDFKVIFTTASSEFAIKAIRARAEDYLLKPIDLDELEEAILKLDFDQKQTASIHTNKFIKLNTTTSESKIVSIDDILFLRNAGNYTTFYLKDKTSHILSKNLGYFLPLLPETQFIRCHQSFIININEIKSYIKGANTQLIMSDDQVVEVSRANKKKIEDLFP